MVAVDRRGDRLRGRGMAGSQSAGDGDVEFAGYRHGRLNDS